MKICGVAEKERVIGRRNDVEEFLDSRVFARVL
jgi:predicted transcriptional regulator